MAVLDTYERTQAWFSETIGVSQSQGNYLLGRTAGDVPRDLDVVEIAAVERRIKREVDPQFVLGQMFRALGLVDDPGGDPEAVIAADPHLLPPDRENVQVVLKLGHRRYYEAHPALAPETVGQRRRRLRQNPEAPAEASQPPVKKRTPTGQDQPE